MKRALFPATALLLLLAAAPRLDAQVVYGISAIDYNPETTIVDGYSATVLDYYACLYYDAYVEGFMYENLTEVDDDSYWGVCDAVAFTDTFADPGNTYTVLSDHYIVAYYYDPGYGYYDPYGFSSFGGEYGGSYNFYGCFCPTYYFVDFIYLGSTAVQITPPPPCDKVPTLRADPASITRGGTVTFRLENLCQQRTIKDWIFVDGGTVTVRRGTSSSTTWSGKMVKSGRVAVTVTQGDLTFTPFADITVNNRTTGFEFPTLPARELMHPQSCDGPMTFETPRPKVELGQYCLRQVYSWTPFTLGLHDTDQGPNKGYRYVQSARNSSTTNGNSDFFYVIHPELKSTSTEFHRAQCGDYDPVTNTGQISGAQLLANTINHEGGANNSHYAHYVTAAKDPQKNIGLGLEPIVGLPSEAETAFKNRVDGVAMNRLDAIRQATAVEPCGGGEVLSAQCQFQGFGNYTLTSQNPPQPKPYTPCRPSGLMTTGVASTKVDLAWTDNSSNEQQFAIKRQEGGSGDFFEMGRVDAGKTAFTDDRVSPSTNYVYAVQAVTGTTFSADSNHLSVRTPASGGGGGAPGTAPSGATAASASSTQINVSWTDTTSNEAGFKIERKTGTAAFAQIATVGANITSYADATVAASTTYTYRVRAYNAAGDSSYSNEISATTPTGGISPPAAPGNLNATAVSSTQVSLSWTDASGNESGFKIERRTGAGAYSQIATVSANVTSYADNAVAASTTYTYRVRAFNSGGDSAASNEASATTPAPSNGPAAPSNLATTAFESQVVLIWTDNSTNETGFKIERATSGGSFFQIATVGANVTNYADTSISLNVNYIYRVRAYNAFGDSAWSNESSATPSVPIPNPPSGLTATAISTSRIDLLWTDHSYNEDGFRLERKTGSGTFTVIATLFANATSYSDTAVAPNTTYSYRIKAFGAGCESPYAPWATATTPVNNDPPPPAAPSNLEGATSQSVFGIEVWWSDNSASETSFRLEKRRSDSFPFVEVAWLEADVMGYFDGDTSPGVTYVYRVRACNAYGCSAYSNEAWVTYQP